MTLCRPIAPEDIATGDFVAILNAELQVPWVNESLGIPKLEVLRTTLRAPTNYPMRVKVICLPYVAVKLGKIVRILDTRSVELVRLDRDYARTVLRELQTKKRKK